jgi:hypothetical protein
LRAEREKGSRKASPGNIALHPPSAFPSTLSTLPPSTLSWSLFLPTPPAIPEPVPVQAGQASRASQSPARATKVSQPDRSNRPYRPKPARTRPFITPPVPRFRTQTLLRFHHFFRLSLSLVLSFSCPSRVAGPYIEGFILSYNPPPARCGPQTLRTPPSRPSPLRSRGIPASCRFPAG